jgi:hypothetical protein
VSSRGVARSPFPGMDFYLEDPGVWRDFHLRFINRWCEALAEVLPESYVARLDERVNLVQVDPAVIKLIHPDVAVLNKSANAATSPRRPSGTALREPVTIPHLALEEVREARIEVFHRPDRTLVAVLELLSPTNKTGEGALEYRAKRKSLLQQNVHVVELDLLLGGQRLPMGQALPVADYYAFVTRSDNRATCDVYAWTKRDRLPTIPVPLLAPDPDVLVDLQVVFDVVYERGRYRNDLAYGDLPPVTLSQEDRSWVQQVLAEEERS